MLFVRKKQQIGPYRIIENIGEGRFGKCFLAEGPDGRLVLKRFKFAFRAKNRVACQYEGRILSELSHHCIPKFRGFINETGFYGLALEEKAGQTVEAILFKQKHRFTRSEIYNIGMQLLEIIKYLHKKAIVHRDIRISNVLIDGSTISLVDFGLARYLNGIEYTRDVDFFYFGDFLLYLFYSSYERQKGRTGPWFVELPLSTEEQLFLKRLLQLAEPYNDIDAIAADFAKYFSC